MTIPSDDARSGPYNGNGSTTVFAYDFKVLDQAHLVVTETSALGVETTKTITTDYTVSGVGADAGGNITMLVAPASGTTLTVTRSVPLTQLVDLQNRGGVQPEVLETAYDKLTQIAQDNAEFLARVPRFPVSSTETAVELPLTMTADAVLKVNSTGDGFENGPTATEISNAEASATAAAASAAAASTSEGNAATSETNAAASAASAAASAAGIYWKEPVLVSSTANLTLSGEQTIDGIAAVSGDRVLVKDQTAPEENGVYIVAAGAWSRATPLDTWDEHVGAVVLVSQGALGENKAYQCTVNAGGTLGTTAITWASFGAVAIDFVVDSFVDVTDYTSGTTTALTLSADPGSEQNITVTFDGITQHHSQYTVSGVTLTFSSAIPLGVEEVEVKIGSSLGIGTPSDGTVTTAKLADEAVTAAKAVIASQAEAEAGTDTTKLVTPERVAQAIAALAGGGFTSMQVFTASGTWTKPAGITKVKVTVVGGGGGGGGAVTNVDYRAQGGAGGGGSVKFIDVSAITSETVTVGAGGAGGTTSGTNGSTGGTSSFGAHCSATGGEGGKGQPNTSHVANQKTSGGAGASGDYNANGNPPIGRARYNTSQDQDSSGGGGSAFFGSGAPETAHINATNGNAAAGIGGGGSGATGSGSGGAGSAGIVIVEEYA